MKKIFSIVLFMTVALMMVSCSESEETSDEYDNWKVRNDEYFETIYQMAQDSINAGNDSWKIIRKYTLGDSTAIENHIVVKVLSESKSDDKPSPIYTDTVAIDYAGYLMPSDNHCTRPYSCYPTYVGYNFQSTWSGNYDLETMKATTGTGWLIGFDTALMNMHAGDRWMIYIPYKIGYNSTEKTGIPAYSTLIFDLTLVKFWHPDIQE